MKAWLLSVGRSATCQFLTPTSPVDNAQLLSRGRRAAVFYPRRLLLTMYSSYAEGGRAICQLFTSAVFWRQCSASIQSEDSSMSGRVWSNTMGRVCPFHPHPRERPPLVGVSLGLAKRPTFCCTLWGGSKDPPQLTQPISEGRPLQRGPRIIGHFVAPGNGGAGD